MRIRFVVPGIFVIIWRTLPAYCAQLRQTSSRLRYAYAPHLHEAEMLPCTASTAGLSIENAVFENSRQNWSHPLASSAGGRLLKQRSITTRKPRSDAAAGAANTKTRRPRSRLADLNTTFARTFLWCKDQYSNGLRCLGFSPCFQGKAAPVHLHPMPVLPVPGLPRRSSAIINLCFGKGCSRW